MIAAFPEAPGLPNDTEAYLSLVDDIYRNDADHSLSIEGYRVTPEMIDRVRAGNWDPDNHDVDRQSRDALAARGYWQAFRLVRGAVGEIVGSGEAGALVHKAHRDWYRELFQPCVAAGLIAASALAGYRNDSVFLQRSRMEWDEPSVTITAGCTTPSKGRFGHPEHDRAKAAKITRTWLAL